MLNNFLRVFIVVGLVTGACSKEHELIIPKGSLKGYVHEYNNSSDGSTQASSNVEVTLEGTDPLVVLKTDVNGRFTTTDLPLGTYNLAYRKEGYGAFKVMGYSFTGGEGSAQPVTLYKLPTTTIKSATLTLAAYSSSQAALSGSILTDQPVASAGLSLVRYYVNTSANVDKSNYSDTGYTFTSLNSTYYAVSALLNTKRYASGSDLYIIFYPTSETSMGYTDFTTGNIIYSNISLTGSPVVKLKVP